MPYATCSQIEHCHVCWLQHTGVAGRKLGSEAKATAPAAVAALLASRDIKTIGVDDVKGVLKSYGLDEKAGQRVLVDIYRCVVIPTIYYAVC